MSKSIKTIDQEIQGTETFQLKLVAAAGRVGSGLKKLRAADVKQIKRELEDATGKKIIREGRPDAVQKVYIEELFVDAVQRTLVVKVGA